MITVEKLSKSYERPVLVGVDAEFATGSITFVMGVNGSGKTTLFKCLLGLESYAGVVRFDGKPLADVRSDIMPVFDDTPFYSRLTGYQNLQMLLMTPLMREDAEDAWSLGGSVSVDALQRQVGGYSRGQRKRLALCLALLSRPKYLILDEIASGLDVETMDAAVVAIQKLAPHATVLMSGHQFEFYGRVIDRAVILRDGRLEPIEVDNPTPQSLERRYRELAGLAQG